jgi:hypothetical protein
MKRKPIRPGHYGKWCEVCQYVLGVGKQNKVAYKMPPFYKKSMGCSGYRGKVVELALLENCIPVAIYPAFDAGRE